MALNVYLHQNHNDDSSAFGKWFIVADNEKPIDLVGLANHMAHHNTPFSEGTIVGILRDMVKCIRELNLGGQPVKIDNLAIFSAHVQCKGGWPSLADVNLGEAEKTVIRQCAQATGDFTKAELTKYGTLQLNREWRTKVQEAKKAAGQPADPEGGSVNP